MVVTRRDYKPWGTLIGIFFFFGAIHVFHYTRQKRRREKVVETVFGNRSKNMVWDEVEVEILSKFK